jgi:hypothetical protein
METVQFVQQNSLPFKKGYTVYADANDALYFFTGKAGKFLPHKDNKAEVQHFLQDEHCYAMIFNDGDNPDLVSLDFILKNKKMKLFKQFADGAIYVSEEE